MSKINTNEPVACRHLSVEEVILAYPLLAGLPKVNLIRENTYGIGLGQVFLPGIDFPLPVVSVTTDDDREYEVPVAIVVTPELSKLFTPAKPEGEKDATADSVFQLIDLAIHTDLDPDGFDPLEAVEALSGLVEALASLEDEDEAEDYGDLAD